MFPVGVNSVSSFKFHPASLYASVSSYIQFPEKFTECPGSDFEYYNAYGSLYMCYTCASDVFAQTSLFFAITTAVLELQVILFALNDPIWHYRCRVV